MKTPLRSFATFASIAVIALAASCGGSASAVGTYQLDVNAILKSMPIPMTPGGEEETSQVVELFRRTMGGSIELRADHTVQRRVKLPPFMNVDESGTWKIVGDQVTITSNEKAEEPKTMTLKDGVLSATENQGGTMLTMTFRRTANG